MASWQWVEPPDYMTELKGPRAREGGGRMSLMIPVCPKGPWPAQSPSRLLETRKHYPTVTIPSGDAELRPSLTLLRYTLYVPGCP